MSNMDFGWMNDLGEELAWITEIISNRIDSVSTKKLFTIQPVNDNE